MSADLQELVYNTLNGQGMLGNIKAQIRTQMYKIINEGDQSIKKQNDFQYQHPLAKKMKEDESIKKTLDLIYEFLEYYQLEYTLSVFKEESQIKQGPNKNVDRKQPNKLCQIVQCHDPKSSQQPVQSKPIQNNLMDSKPQQKSQLNPISKQEVKKPGNTLLASSNQITGTGMGSLANIKGFGSSLMGSTSKGDPYSFSIDDEKKDDKMGTKPGFNKKIDNNFGANSKKQDNSVNFNNKQNKKQEVKKQDDNMFEELEIDEDIIEEIDDAENFMSTDKRNDKRGKGGNIHTSSEDMLASQSQGYDMSVDSLALEEYDYYENVELAR